MSGRYQIFFADGELFDHDHARAFGMGQQFRLTVHEVNVSWKDIRRLRANVVAAAKEIRRVVLAEMRKGGSCCRLILTFSQREKEPEKALN